VQEGLPLTGDAKFLIDHPPTPERVEALALGVDRSPYAKSKLPPEWVEMHARMKAKLIGYFEPEFALRKYSRADTSVAGRYARSIALFKVGQLQPALQLIDGLIAQEPNNPYFAEMKGQMLFENGRVAEAVAPLKAAAALAPKNTDEIHTLYAQVLLERNDSALLPTAIDELKTAVHAEPRSPDTHRFLAIAYGRQGNEAVAKVELAEQAILEGRVKEGRQFALSAMRLLPTGSREWLHAQDLVASSQSSKRRSSDDDSPGLHMSVGPANSQMGNSRFGNPQFGVPAHP
jgi:predicted Zn-dependent protease